MVLSAYAWEQDAATNELLSVLTEIMSLASPGQPGDRGLSMGQKRPPKHFAQ